MILDFPGLLVEMWGAFHRGPFLLVRSATTRSGTATGKRLAPHSSNVFEEPLPKPPSDLRRWANQKFGHETGPATSIGFRRIGNLGKGAQGARGSWFLSRLGGAWMGKWVAFQGTNGAITCHPPLRRRVSFGAGPSILQDSEAWPVEDIII